jgi:uncharacterized protein with NRDE domain
MVVRFTSMCLLAVFFKSHPAAPLVLAANRDEYLSRPSSPIQVLEENGGRIVGGRDDLARGTWLAINERGLMAGLTNGRTPSPRDPSKRSRGELPLLLARATSAAEAVEEFRSRIKPLDYYPCWILAGDRDRLFYLSIQSRSLEIRELNPGLHILENCSLDQGSEKTRWVARQMEPIRSSSESDLVGHLREILASHEVSGEAPAGIPRETRAACVHAGNYGTRSSTVAWAPADRAVPPRLFFGDGPPCSAAHKDANHLWTST